MRDQLLDALKRSLTSRNWLYKSTRGHFIMQITGFLLPVHEGDYFLLFEAKSLDEKHQIANFGIHYLTDDDEDFEPIDD